MSAARLFAAADLPSDVRGRLAAWAGRAGGSTDGLRPVAVENLHLTLVFLGARDEAEAPRIGELVAGAAAGPVEVALGEALWLAPRRPHVLTVALADRSGALAALQARVEAALVAGAGHEAQPRAFRPHVTVARVRRGVRVRPAEVALPAVPEAVFGLEALTLYRSRTGPGGSRYEPVARVGLG